MATFPDLTTSQLRQAIEIREQIDSLQEKLDVLLGGTAPKAESGDPAAKRTKPAAGHTRTDAAPVWHLAYVKSPLDTLLDGAPKKKGGITAAGRAKLAAAMKARWAAKKKGAPTPNASAS